MLYRMKSSCDKSSYTDLKKYEGTDYIVLYCDVVLIYYTHVLNKVSSYTVLVESC